VKINCVHCGGEAGCQGHYWKMPPEPWCEKGLENKRLQEQDLPLKWRYGELTAAWTRSESELHGTKVRERRARNDFRD